MSYFDDDDDSLTVVRNHFRVVAPTGRLRLCEPMGGLA